MNITLQQFEQIDHLYNVASAAERKADATGDYSREAYFRPVWELEAAVIEAIGYQRYQSYASAQEAALEVIFGALVDEIEVIDEADFDADYAQFNSEYL